MPPPNNPVGDDDDDLPCLIPPVEDDEPAPGPAIETQVQSSALDGPGSPSSDSSSFGFSNHDEEDIFATDQVERLVAHLSAQPRSDSNPFRFSNHNEEDIAATDGVERKIGLRPGECTQPTNHPYAFIMVKIQEEFWRVPRPAAQAHLRPLHVLRQDCLPQITSIFHPAHLPYLMGANVQARTLEPQRSRNPRPHPLGAWVGA